jgi:plasmid stabilization system protein ParE
MKIEYSKRAVSDLQNINLFYAVGEDTLRILHIRHTSRRPWPAG